MWRVPAPISCEPICDRLALQRQTIRAAAAQRLTAHRRASVSISVGYISIFTEQPNKVLQAPQVCRLRCSLTVRFVRRCSLCVRSVKVLKTSLMHCNQQLFVLFGEKNEMPHDLQKQSENVVGGLLKCSQKLYTWHFTSHNIYRDEQPRAERFSSALLFAKMLTCYQTFSTFSKVVSAWFVLLAFWYHFGIISGSLKSPHQCCLHPLGCRISKL